MKKIHFETDKGEMVAELYDDDAPETVANFVGLATGEKEWTDPKTNQKHKGTPYFDSVRNKVRLPVAWAEASDRDYVIEGRHGKDYYRLADVWLRNEVEASRIGSRDPARAAELRETARQARDQMSAFASEPAA